MDYSGIINILKRVSGKDEGVGTGFFVSEDGYILTCLHVLKEAGCARKDDQVNFRCNDSAITQTANVVDFNLNEDVALLKSNEKSNEFYPLTLNGTPSDILSTTGFPGKGENKIHANFSYEVFIKGEKHILLGNANNIFHGFSGAPAILGNGDSVGIISVIPNPNIAKSRMSDIAFAIPANVILNVFSRFLHSSERMSCETKNYASTNNISKDIHPYLKRCLKPNDSYVPLYLNQVNFDDENIVERISAEFFLTDMLPNTLDKHPVIILGESSSGKSTLIARFYEKNHSNYSIIYIPVRDLCYGKQDTFSIWDYLYREYFKEISDESMHSVRQALVALSIQNSKLTIIIDGYDELEKYHAAQGGGGYIETLNLLNNDIVRLKQICNRVIITTKSKSIRELGLQTDYEVFKFDRIQREYVRKFLDDNILRLKEYKYTEGELNDLTENLRTPYLLTAFHSVIKNYKRLVLPTGVNPGMYEKPINKGQIFYNFLYDEMFKYIDNHSLDKLGYAIVGHLFIRYVVPSIAHFMHSKRAVQISIRELIPLMESFLSRFTEDYVNKDCFDDILDIVVAKNNKNLIDEINGLIGTNGQHALNILVTDYHILYREGDYYFFEHPVLGEVLTAIDIYNTMLVQCCNSNFNIKNSGYSRKIEPDMLELFSNLNPQE